MVWRKAEGIKILVRAYDGMECVVGFEGRSGEDGFKNLSSDGDRVVLLEVELSRSGCQNVSWRVVPVIGREGLATDCDGRRGGR